MAAHRGDLDEARRYVDAATAITREEGSLLPRAVDCISRAMVDMLAGDLAAAEEVLRGYLQLEEMGGTGPRVNVAALLARVRCAQPQRGRRGAHPHLERLAAPDQADAQVKWRSIRAIAVARRGERRRRRALARRPSTWPARPTSSTRGPRPTSTWPRSCSWVAAAAKARAGAGHRPVQEKGNEVGERNARRLLARTRS